MEKAAYEITITIIIIVIIIITIIDLAKPKRGTPRIFILIV